MIPSLAVMEQRERRRLILSVVVRVVVVTAVLFAAYAVLPARRFGDGGPLARLVVSLTVVAAVLAWQVRSIMRSRHPQARAAEATAIAVVFVIVMFAFGYLSLSASEPGSFNERLDHIGALYFTISALATVGFGDIAAHSGTARLMVSAQMLLDLVLLVLVGRLFFGAARVSLGRSSDADSDS